MLTLLYGTDSIGLYEKIDEYKEKGYVSFYGSKGDLKAAANSISLFGDSKKFLVNIELNSVITIDSIFELPTKSVDLVIVSPNTKTVKPSLLKKFDSVNKLLIEDNKEIFKFLDYLFLKDLKNVFPLYNKFIDQNQDIYITSMIFYSLKNILMYYVDSISFSNLNPYVQQKTKAYINKGNISYKKAHTILSALSELDYKSKSGGDRSSLLFSLISYIAL